MATKKTAVKPKVKKLEPLSLSKAKKKYSKLAKDAKKKYTAANKKYHSYNAKVTHVKKQLDRKGLDKTLTAHYKSLLGRLEPTLRSYRSKASKAKAASSKAARNYRNYRHSPEVELMHKNNTLKNMKKDRDWKHADKNSLIPKYPWSDDSYALFYITDFQPTHESSINSTSVEHGFYVSSAGQMTAPSYSITGYLGGEPKDSMGKIKKQVNRIQGYADDTTQVIWTGDQSLKSAVVTSFSPDFNHAVDSGGTNAVQFSMTITGVSFAESTVKQKKHATHDSGKKRPKKGSSKGKHYVIAKRGDTYWGIATKHKVKISTVEKKNKYASTRIPVGAKIYY